MTEKASATWIHNEGDGETLEWWCNEDKEHRDVLLRMSLPSMVSGSSDTYVRDSTTVSKQRRMGLKMVRCLAPQVFFEYLQSCFQEFMS